MKKYSFILLFFCFLLFIKFSYAQAPVADFSADVTTGCDVLVVHFTDLSTNNPDSWQWDFGNSVTSTEQNPAIVYFSSGFYTVTLTATNSSGSDTKIKTDYIRIYVSPVSNFSANPLSGCAPLTVNFTDLSSADTLITNRLWNFGDGGSDVTQNPTHIYNNSGTFQVSLSITDAHGCSSQKIINNYISVAPQPTASFISSQHQSCWFPLNVDFTSTSTPSAGLSYFWDFGDGDTSTQQNPSHNYISSGSFDVTLIVTGPNGCSDTVVQNNYTNINIFQSDFVADTNSGCMPLTVNFTDMSPGAVDWQWDFGDASPVNTLQNPLHTYLTSGSYTVTLISKDTMDCYDTIYFVNFITVYPLPNVDFTVDDSIGCSAPFALTFTDNTFGAVGWQWDFGDGNTSMLQNPSNTYLNVDSFDVSLIVTDFNGCTDTLIKQNFIKIMPPIAYFGSDFTQGCIPLTINFADSSISNNVIVSWNWDFGDASPVDNNQNPSHIYNNTGVYPVTLTITDSEGCTDSTVKIVRAGTPPVTDFASDDTLVCHGVPIQFSDSSTGSVNSWYWYFGDGGIDTSQNPLYTYSDTGYFSVTLISAFNGCEDSLTKIDYVYILPPNPMFGADPEISCVYPDTVMFFNLSQGADTSFMDFGDGSPVDTITQDTILHIYQNPGFYDVKLIATNSNGCIDSLTKTNFIKISDIIPGFFQDSLQGCQYGGITFIDTSYANDTLVNWMWDFGDGTIIDGDYPNPIHYYDSAGVFSSKMVVTDTLGCKDSLIKPNSISVHALPSPVFTADTTYGCVPLTVTFDPSLSSPVFPASLIMWIWDFGDGSPVDTNFTNDTIIHIYQIRGNYTVKLTVLDTKGCDSTLIKVNYINPTYPYTDFTSDTIICFYDSVAFTNTSTGGGLTYIWDFGDASPVDTSVNPLHLYITDTTAVFDVSLTATDTNGCDSTIVKQITISRPVANFGADTAFADCPPLFTTFTDSSTADISNWFWDFGDTASGSSNISVFSDPQHVFENAGVYSITLITINIYGCMDTLIRPDYVFVNGPSGTFDFFPKAGCAPLDVTFIANAQNTEIYYWIFGDGGSITTGDTINGDTIVGDTVTYTYTQGGTYLPALVIEDSTGCQVQILAQQPISLISGEIDFTVSDTLSCFPSSFQFVDLSNPSSNIDSWLWDFGDGATSTLQHPLHLYDSSGIYDVTLTITIDSCVYSLTKPNFLSVFTFPDIDFTLSDTAACSPLIVEFIIIDSTVTSPVSTWEWDFNDGTSVDNNKNPIHYFYNSGIYNIDLSVIFQNGCQANYTKPANLTVYPNPVANFYTDKNNVYVNDIILFIDSSLGTNVAWYWDFGDNATSTEQNSYHNYQYIGDYQTMLVVTSSDGCLDTTYKIINIIEMLKIPNAFTPDGDGINDIFMKNWDLIILNRWGQTLYQGMDGWDGKYKGEYVSPGTYFYIISMGDVKNKTKKLTGSVTVIRK